MHPRFKANDNNVGIKSPSPPSALQLQQQPQLQKAVGIMESEPSPATSGSMSRALVVLPIRSLVVPTKKNALAASDAPLAASSPSPSPPRDRQLLVPLTVGAKSVKKSTSTGNNENSGCLTVVERKENNQISSSSSNNNNNNNNQQQQLVLLSQKSPASARLISNSGFNARDVVMEIQRGGAEQSIVHSTGIAKKSLAPLALELSAFVRREMSRVNREQQQQQQQLVKGTYSNRSASPDALLKPSSRASPLPIQLQQQRQNPPQQQQQQSIVATISQRLRIASETLSHFAAHFPGYEDCLGMLVSALSSSLKDCVELDKQVAELSLLRHNSEALVEQSLQEAREYFSAKAAAAVVEREKQQARIQELEQQVKVVTGNLHYTQRQHTATLSSLDKMTKRCALFQESIEEETQRSIKLTHRLARLTNTNVVLQANISFLDKLLREAEEEVEKFEKMTATGSKLRRRSSNRHAGGEKTSRGSSKKRRKKKQTTTTISTGGATTTTTTTSSSSALADPTHERKMLAEMNRKSLQDVISDTLAPNEQSAGVNNNTKKITGNNNNNNNDDDDEHDETGSSDEDSDDSGRSVVSSGDGRSNNNNNQSDDDDTEDDDIFDPNNPITSRADRKVIRGISTQRTTLVSIDAQLKKLSRANAELLQKLRLVEKERDDARAELAERQDDTTPRPSWVRVKDHLPHFILDVAASSDEILDDVLLACRAEMESGGGSGGRKLAAEAEVARKSNALDEWLRSEQLSVGDIAAAARSRFFIARGSAPSVPVYLRTPPSLLWVPNKRLSKFSTESILKKFWRARRAELHVPTSEQVYVAYRISNTKERQARLRELREQQKTKRVEMMAQKKQQQQSAPSSSSYDGGRSSSTILPIEYFFANFCTELTGSLANGIVLAYNIDAVTSQSMSDPDCAAFQKMMTGQISEHAVMAAEDVVSVVRGTLDVAAPQGFLSKSSCQRILLSLFPQKTKEDHLKLRAQLALCAAQQSGNTFAGHDGNSNAGHPHNTDASTQHHHQHHLIHGVGNNRRVVTVNRTSNHMVNLRALFAEDADCNENSFVCELRMQAIESYTLFSLEMENAMRSSSDRSTGFISVSSARYALQSVDAGMPEEKIVEVLAAGFNLLNVNSSVLRDPDAAAPLEPFLDRVRRNVLLQRYAPSIASQQRQQMQQLQQMQQQQHQQRGKGRRVDDDDDDIVDSARNVASRSQRFENILTKSATNFSCGPAATTKGAAPLEEQEDAFFDFMHKLIEEEAELEEFDEDDEVDSIQQQQQQQQQEQPKKSNDASYSLSDGEDHGTSTQLVATAPAAAAGAGDKLASSPSSSGAGAMTSAQQQQQQHPLNRRGDLLKRSFHRRQEDFRGKQQHKKEQSRAMALLERDMIKASRERQEEQRAQEDEEEQRRLRDAEAAAASSAQAEEKTKKRNDDSVEAKLTFTTDTCNNKNKNNNNNTDGAAAAADNNTNDNNKARRRSRRRSSVFPAGSAQQWQRPLIVKNDETTLLGAMEESFSEDRRRPSSLNVEAAATAAQEAFRRTYTESAKQATEQRRKKGAQQQQQQQQQKQQPGGIVNSD